MSKLEKKILFQLSGSIACYKAADIISCLVKLDFNIQTVCTPSALKFIGEATLEGLTGRPCLTDNFTKGQMMNHISLAREYELHVLCPATAHTLNRLSTGLCDDLVGALFLSNNFHKPYWIFPAMNTQMLEHPATQQSLQRLQSWGAKVFDTDSGALACGEVGEGRLLNTEKIVQTICQHFGVSQ